MKKYNLKCFTCNHPFKDKSEVFRTLENHAICEDCLWEYLEHDWDMEGGEYMIAEIKKKFGGSYKKWSKDFYENNEECDGEHDYYGTYYAPKHDMTVIDGKKYCTMCMDERIEYESEAEE